MKKNKIISLIIGIVVGLAIGFLIFIFIFPQIFRPTIDKPIIYIYPEEDMNVNIKVSNPELLTHTYPKYQNEWNVFVETSSNIQYKSRNYYSLYYEAERINSAKLTNDGFIVKGEDTIEFLERKLDILGLNEREANEFIIYWLPKLEKNKYNYIRFETMEEIESNMKLEITPKPDTLIRVWMAYKPLDEKIDIQEQVLTKVERSGYTIVEWGGSKI